MLQASPVLRRGLARAAALAGALALASGAYGQPQPGSTPTRPAPQQEPGAGGTGRTDLGEVLMLIDRLAKEREAAKAREEARRAAERAVAEKAQAEQAAAEAVRLKEAAEAAAAAARAEAEKAAAVAQAAPVPPAPAPRPTRERPTPAPRQRVTAAPEPAPTLQPAPPIEPATVPAPEPAMVAASPPPPEPPVIPPPWWRTPVGSGGLGAGFVLLLAVGGYLLLRRQAPGAGAAGPVCRADAHADLGEVGAPDFAGLSPPALSVRVTAGEPSADVAYPAAAR